MPLFDYKCPRGHWTTTSLRTEAVFCGSDCSEIATRRFSFRINKGIQPHFNPSVGRYVNSEQEFKDELKRAAERQSLTLGYDTEFNYVDPADVPSQAGITEEGLDATRRRQHDSAAVGLSPEEFAARHPELSLDGD